MTDTSERTEPRLLDGYTTGEKIAGVVGAVLFLALLAISIDMATGGKLFNPAARKPCADCGDEAAPDVAGD